MGDGLRIGVVGSGFGRAHLQALTAIGHPAEVVWSRRRERAEAAARDKGVPRWTDDLADLDGCHVVTIATPPHTHRGLIERFLARGATVLCEKPLWGQPIDPAWLDRFADQPVFVHYSFAYLRSAQAIAAHLRQGALGRVFKVVANIRASFDGPLGDPVSTFLGVASHELAWLQHCFGPLRGISAQIGTSPTRASVQLSNGAQDVDLNLVQGSRFGIIMDITMFAERGEYRLAGGWYGAERWRFEPVTADGERLTDGEFSTGECIWFESNRRWFASVFDHLRGGISRQEMIADGVCDLHRAAGVERALAPLFALRRG